MTTALIASPACPVCGDTFAVTPRRCDRCETPHHPECWDYLPGCAIFGCEEQALVPALSRPWTHALILARARLSSFNANMIQLGAMAFFGAVGAGTTSPKDPMIQFVACLFFLLCLTIPAQIAVEVAFRLSPAHAALGDALKDGDRRLQRGIERRSGRLVRLPSWALAWILGTLPFLPPFFKAVWQSLGSGSAMPWKLLGALTMLPLGGALFGLCIFPFLALTERWIGGQRILLRRLEAAQGLPEKPGKS